MAICNTYFTDIWDILWPFGTYCVNSLHLFQFWYNVSRKSGNPAVCRPEMAGKCFRPGEKFVAERFDWKIFGGVHLKTG
jgi:hypothetical protein